MDPVHDRGSMEPVHILMDPVHGPGPQRGSMDRGSMFCTFPIFTWLIPIACPCVYVLYSLIQHHGQSHDLLEKCKMVHCRVKTAPALHLYTRVERSTVKSLVQSTRPDDTMSLALA